MSRESRQKTHLSDERKKGETEKERERNEEKERRRKKRERERKRGNCLKLINLNLFIS